MSQAKTTYTATVNGHNLKRNTHHVYNFAWVIVTKEGNRLVESGFSKTVPGKTQKGYFSAPRHLPAKIRARYIAADEAKYEFYFVAIG